MIFLIVNAALSALLFLVVILPPLYIFNPNIYPGESSEPPRAGEVIPDDDVTHSVKQKLYLLFIIPTCATVNAIFFYFAYYRPIRFIHYRVELNLLALRLTLDAGRQQLQKSGVLQRQQKNAAAQNLSIIGASTSTISRSYSKAPGRNFLLDGNESSRQKMASSFSWEWRRHARPKSVLREAWVNSAVFAEISDLRDEVEQRFLLEGNVADANYTHAVVKTIGAFVPATKSTIMVSPRRASKTESPQRGFYNSSQPPLLSLGARAAGTERSGGRGGAMRVPPMEHDQILPLRDESVVMVPTESTHRHTTNNNSSKRGSGSGAASAFRFFKGGGRTRSSSSGKSASGNQMEQGPSTEAPPTRRIAFEPLQSSGNSPTEPASGGTAVRSSNLGEASHSGGDGAVGKPSPWSRMWRRNEPKEA